MCSLSLCSLSPYQDSDLHITWALGNTPVLPEFTPAAGSPLHCQQRDTLSKEAGEEHPAQPLWQSKQRCLNKSAMTKNWKSSMPRASTAWGYRWNPSPRCAWVTSCQTTMGCFENFTLSCQCLGCYTACCWEGLYQAWSKNHSSWKLSHCKIFRNIFIYRIRYWNFPLNLM